MIRNTVLSLLLASLLTGCASFTQVGSFNQVTTRNIDPGAKYQLLTSYIGGSHAELSKSHALTIDAAVNNTIRKVPGGEYMMNVKVYLVNQKYFACEGDVYGIAGVEPSFRGFKNGDKVSWKNIDTYYTGTIISLVDDEKCLVKFLYQGKERTMELKYTLLTKVQ